MSIHEFDFQSPGQIIDQSRVPKYDAPRPPDIRQGIKDPPQSGKSASDIFFDDININTSDSVKDVLTRGFYTMDKGMKNYFSGIRIPTKDGVRMMNVRIAGGDRTLLVWNQDLRGGRVTLPVMSINRSGTEYNSEKFSPPHHYMTTQFVDRAGEKIKTAYRPVPYLINYDMTIWAEHKTDAEYALYQIQTRLNPLADFIVEDEFLRGSVQLRYTGFTDNSDKEVDSATRANVRYDINTVLEGWLPLPGKVLPSILGRVTTLKEGTTTLQIIGGMTNG